MVWAGACEAHCVVSCWGEWPPSLEYLGLQWWGRLSLGGPGSQDAGLSVALGHSPCVAVLFVPMLTRSLFCPRLPASCPGCCSVLSPV